MIKNAIQIVQNAIKSVKNGIQIVKYGIQMVGQMVRSKVLMSFEMLENNEQIEHLNEHIER